MEKIGDPPTWSQFFPCRRRAEQEFEAAFDDVIEGAGADIGCGSEHCVEKQLAQRPRASHRVAKPGGGYTANG